MAYSWHIPLLIICFPQTSGYHNKITFKMKYVEENTEHCIFCGLLIVSILFSGREFAGRTMCKQYCLCHAIFWNKIRAKLPLQQHVFFDLFALPDIFVRVN